MCHRQTKVDTPKARFYGHRFSGKLQFSGQYCYDGRILFTNSGNFNITDTIVGGFAQKRGPQ